MKKIYLALILGLFLVSFTSAADWDDKLEFNESAGEYGEYEVYDSGFLGIGKGDLEARYQLTENKYGILKGEARIDVQLFKDEQILADLKLYNKEGEEVQLKSLTKEIEYYKTVEKEVPTYKEVCEIVPGNETNSTQEVCSQVQNGTKIESYEELVREEYFEDVEPVGNYTLILTGERSSIFDGAVDWVIVTGAGNKKLTKWAFWWDNNWEFKREITITENSANTLNNYSTLIYVTYDSDMQNDFDDLRFLDSTESQELGYWIKNKTDGVGAWVWVKVPSLTASSNTSIYMYYGNSVASSNSNPKNSFLFYEDFEDPIDYNIWEPWQSAGWSGAFTQTSGYLEISSTGSSYTGRGITAPNNTFSGALYYQYDVYQSSEGGRVVFATEGNTLASGVGSESGNIYRHWVSGLDTTNFGSSITNQWKTNTFILNDTISIATINDGATSNSKTGFVNDQIYFPSIYTFKWGSNTLARYDNLIVKRYSSVEPTYSIGEEQTANALSVELISPTQNSKFDTSQVNFECRGFDDTELLSLKFYLNGQINETINPGTATYTYAQTKTLADGDYTWTCGVCDADTCKTAETRSFEIDTQDPSLSVSSPIHQMYLLDNQTLDLNWSVSDVNLDACWYEYQGQTHQLSCNSGHIQFSYKEGVNNFIIYANDTFNHTTQVNHNFKPYFQFRNISYNKESYETNRESFLLVAARDPETEINNIKLSYNGVNHSVNNVSSDAENVYYEVSFDLPLNENPFEIQENVFGYYMTIDGVVRYLGNYSQNSSYIVLKDCDATYNNVALDFTMYDEKTRKELNTTEYPADISASFKYWMGEGSIQKEFFYSQVYTNENNFKFCSNGLDMNADVDVLFSAQSHAENIWGLNSATIGNTSQELPLYLLHEVYAIKFYVHVKDGLNGIGDATVHVDKYDEISGEFKTISIKKTDVDGDIAAYFELDNLYRFTVITEEGAEIQEKNAKCSASPCELTVQLNSDTVSLKTGYEENFAEDIASNLDWNKESKIITYSFVDTTGLATYFRLEVKQGENVICDKKAHAISGVMTCDVSNYTGEFFAKTYISRSPEKLDKIKNFILEPIQKIGIVGLIGLIILLGSIVFVTAKKTDGNPSSILLSLGVSILIFKLTRFWPFGWVSTSVICILCLVGWGWLRE